MRIIQQRRIPESRLYVWGCLFLLVSPAWAASDSVCENRLKAAIEAYEIGAFEKVPGLLEPCLEKGFSAEEKIQAFAVLAKTHLAEDRHENAAAMVTQLLTLFPHYAPGFDDPQQFKDLVNEVQSAQASSIVTSVSKTKEDPWEAPATVIFLSSEEIMRRGYLDLEALLHDLPGFDLSRGNGIFYSNFYQRGFRSTSNDRTLFLVDGVEENDIWSNAAILSRQYPLTHIERVEVIYGPASTMYGANAFLGVINIITKQPEELLGQDESFAVKAMAGGGSWGSHYTDITLAGRSPSKHIRFSLTTRLYRSDEMDLSGFEDWDYDPAYYETVPYFEILGLSPQNPGDAALVETARAFDQAAVGQLVGSRPLVHSDVTDDWAINGKLRFYNLTMGFQFWRAEEGPNNWFTDDSTAGPDNGTKWIPKQRFFFLKYHRGLGSKLDLLLFSRIKQTRLDGNTKIQQLQGYANGRLDVRALRLGVPSFWQSIYFDQSSSQVKTEMTLIYRHSSKWKLVGGLEIRNSIIQGDYLFTLRGPVAGANREDTLEQSFDHFDIGLFTQAAYQFNDDLKFVAGARVDHNDVRQTEGYGTVFNPRLAVIYAPAPYIVKAIYSEAFKDPSNFNRYSTIPGVLDLPNPSLEPEDVKNFELTAGWRAHERFFVDASLYRATYSNALEIFSVPFPPGNTSGGTTLQNHSVGTLEIVGFQAQAKWRLAPYELFGNLTFTEPKNTNPLDPLGRPRTDVTSLRVGDIAEFRMNLGVNARFGNLNGNFRINYVGDRQTGKTTTVGDNRFDQIEAYLVANLAVTYENALPGLNLQLFINNLFDESYYHPGVNFAARNFVPRIPQNERAFFLRLIYDF